MLVQRVEKHQLKYSKELDELCFNSKNLYNYCNYLLRQSFIETGKIPKEYDLSHQLVLEKQEDWIKMGSNTNQQILKLLYKNWKAFFNALKSYKREPEKFSKRPKPPKYKHKSKGRNIVIFSCNNKTNIKDGYFSFPKFTKLKHVKTKVTNQNLCQARIIPLKKRFVLEIVYEIEIKDELELNDNYLSIDLGVNNFATCYDSKNNSCFIINGGAVKSYNRYWNKEVAKYSSILEIVNKKKKSNRINQLTLKRENKINDYMNKTSKYILDYCKENDITHIIVGHNLEWKQDFNKRKDVNQNFIQIPFNRFIDLLRYKCENYGIEFKETEESYTSKTDHSIFEEMKHLEERKGKRKYRGLFKQACKKVLNADLNGAIGILRKVIDESSFKKIVDRGFVTNPNKINIYSVK